MKYRMFAVLLLTSILLHSYAQDWQAAGDKIKTPWAAKVDPANPLPEYPRPALARDLWSNLNGLWDYAILLKVRASLLVFDERLDEPLHPENEPRSLQFVERQIIKL